MNRYLLDTSAFLALRDNELGAERVEALLLDAVNGKVVVHGCFMSLMEILYRVWKDEGEEAGRKAHAHCLSLPVKWIHETPELLESAGRLKAIYRISLADAWISASAILSNSTLVHKDPEFESVQELQDERLPYK